MRFVTAALVALAVSPAAAETVTSVGSACEVRFVRAPDDVRHVIESWLAAESHCQSSIDLRVLPIEDGYYLLAQRPDGRIHERVVPDAQSAGVLVASWVADDWTTEPPAPLPAAPRPVIGTSFEGPGNALGASVGERSTSRHWLTLTPMLRATGAGAGLRVEIDVVKRGAWSVTAAVALASTVNETVGDPANPWEFGTQDLKGVAQLTRTTTFGNWDLRLALGVGAMHTSSQMRSFAWGYGDPWQPDHIHGVGEVTPVGEVAALISRRVGKNWAVTAGANATFMNQQLLTFDPGDGQPAMELERRHAELMLVSGVRYAL